MRKRVKFDPYALLEALERNRVSYVVVGGFARVVHGSGEVTTGLDVAPSLREENLRRLARALDELGPTRKGAGPIQPRSSRATSRSPSRRLPARSRSCRVPGGRAATTTSASAATAKTSAAACARRPPQPSTSYECSKPVRASKTFNVSNACVE